MDYILISTLLSLHGRTKVKKHLYNGGEGIDIPMNTITAHDVSYVVRMWLYPCSCEIIPESPQRQQPWAKHPRSCHIYDIRQQVWRSFRGPLFKFYCNDDARFSSSQVSWSTTFKHLFVLLMSSKLWFVVLTPVQLPLALHTTLRIPQSAHTISSSIFHWLSYCPMSMVLHSSTQLLSPPFRDHYLVLPSVRITVIFARLPALAGVPPPAC